MCSNTGSLKEQAVHGL